MLELNKVYCGDCLDIMKDIPDNSIDLVLTDPPYGINISTYDKQSSHKGSGIKKQYDLSWNDKPSIVYFDEILRISKNQIIWGGNYFTLSPSQCWLVWDKKNDDTDFADVELAWTSFDKASRIFRWRWNGMLQENMGKKKEYREHPTRS
jgi:site-specific DNA-methyltransferase (adenine-specific)